MPHALSLLSALAMLGASMSGPPIRSVYTSLEASNCTFVEFDEQAEWGTQRCRGVGGHRLLVHYADMKSSVDIVAPGGAVYPLNYWSTITPASSDLGSRAEWRVEGSGRNARPVALIVRVNAITDWEQDRRTSYLAVARIWSGGACVTDRIGPSSDMNERARRAADRAASRHCLAS